MHAFGTYFQNDPQRPLQYGPVELINPPRQRLRGEPKKEGILAHPVIVGFCGTDHELMEMGRRGELAPKFPAGQNRLINGHEGVVWVPDQKRFAIVLIRGGDSIDPTRFNEDETYFEYGCDQADGLFCDRMWIEKTARFIPLRICINLTVKKRKSIPDQIGDILLKIPAHCCQAFLPLFSVPAPDGQDVGLCDIAVCLHECFQFRTPQRIEKHILLQVSGDLGIRNNQLRKNGMGSTAFLTLDAKYAKDNGSLSGLKSSSVIAMAYQAASMPAAAEKSV